MSDRVVHALLYPLDRLRLRLLHAFAPVARPLLTRRDLRVGVWGTLLVSSALAGTLVAPLLLLALGPVVLGVPHLVADVRYLAVRPGLLGDRRLLPAGALLAGAAITASVELGVAAAFAAALTSPNTSRRTAVLGGLTALFGVAVAMGPVDRIVFAHAHNAIALVLWWTWRPGRPLLHVVPVALFVAGAALIMGGYADAGAHALSDVLPRGLGIRDHAAVLAPGVSPVWATRLVVLFAFAQSVHYAVWLRLMPEDDRPRRTPRTWRASWDALVADFGRPALLGCVALSAVFVGWAMFDLALARAEYLRLAIFHGHLELVALALLASGRTLRTA